MVSLCQEPVPFSEPNLKAPYYKREEVHATKQTQFIEMFSLCSALCVFLIFESSKQDLFTGEQ